MKILVLNVNQYFLSIPFAPLLKSGLYEVIQCDANQNVDSFATLPVATLPVATLFGSTFHNFVKKWIESIYDVVFL